MTIKELFGKSYEIYSKHKLESWSIAVVYALLSASILLLASFNDLISIFTIPLLIIPFTFAITMIHYGFRYNNELTFKNIWKFFLTYFSPQFNGTYKVIKSFFKSLIVEIIATFVLTVGIVIFYYITHQANAIQFINDFEAFVYSESVEYFDYEYYLNLDNGLLMNLLFYSQLVSSGLGLMSFVLFCSRSSISLKTRMGFKNAFPSFVSMFVDRALKRNKKEFNKYYYGTNWPLFVFMMLGLISGAILSVYYEMDYSYVSAFSIAGGMLFTLFYLPFYLSNMEAIGEIFDTYFKKESQILANEQLNAMKIREQMNKEFEETLKKMNEDQKNMSDENNQDEHSSDDGENNSFK